MNTAASPFRQPIDEASWSLATVDELIALHHGSGLCVSTCQGKILPSTRAGAAEQFMLALLQHARFGFLVREVAAANPSLSADAAIATAQDRLRRER